MPANRTQLLEHLEQLRLPWLRDHCTELAAEAARTAMPHLDFLGRLVAGETALRFERLVARRLREARLPFVKTLDQYNWKHPTRIDRAQIQALFTLDFLHDHTNVVFVGTVGLGKTHLMLALANTACVAGYSVLFTTAAAMVNNLAAAQLAGRLPRELRKYTSPQLLCIDELGFVPLDKTAADLLFQVVSERYERGSIALTTNRIYKEWAPTFNNDSVFTSALLDRLVHHCQTVIIQGKSFRQHSECDER